MIEVMQVDMTYSNSRCRQVQLLRKLHFCIRARLAIFCETIFQDAKLVTVKTRAGLFMCMLALGAGLGLGRNFGIAQYFAASTVNFHVIRYWQISTPIKTFDTIHVM